MAGGKDSPMVDFLSHMSKQFGDNPTLGEEFMHAVVETQWSKTTMHPLTKVALTVANCTSMKLIDGVAKLITKTDILALKAKKYETILNEVERSLGFLWTALTEMSALDRYDKFKIFSKYCIRYSLFITNKQKHGREGKVYSMEEIKAMMNNDLKTPVTASSLPLSASSVKPEGASQEAEALDISQANSSMFIATLGLKIGNTYTIKDQGTSRVWLLTEMTDKEVTLVHIPLLEPTKKLTMKFKESEIVDNLKQSKAKLPTLVDPKLLDALIPSNNDMCTLEFQKAEVFLALVNAYNQWDLEATDMLLQDTPHHAVYANHDMKKGFVQLVPYPEKISSIVMKEPSGSSAKHGVVRYLGNTFYIMGPKNYKIDGATGKVDGIFAPFWGCLKEDTGGSLELKFKQFSIEGGTCEIQILTNTESIAKHGQLMLKASESGTKKRKVK